MTREKEKNRPSPGAGAEGKRNAPRPTVFTPSGGAKAVSPVERGHETKGPAKTTAVAAPTAMPGVERKRIAVAASDLRKLAPAAESGVIEQAMRLLQTFVVETATDRSAVSWGYSLQKAYSDLVSQTLALSQSAVLRKADGYLRRMMDILGSIDLAAVCEVEAGIVGKYLRKVTKKIDSPQELEAARAELDQLLSLMNASFDELLNLKDQLERHAAKIGKLGVEAEAAALAALYLSDYLQKEKATAPLSQRFTERSMSLTQTLAQIQGGAAIRDMQIEQPLRLVAAIQNVALVMVPGLLGSLASLLTLMRNRKPTPTEAGELADQLRNILDHLQTT